MADRMMTSSMTSHDLERSMTQIIFEHIISNTA